MNRILSKLIVCLTLHDDKLKILVNVLFCNQNLHIMRSLIYKKNTQPSHF